MRSLAKPYAVGIRERLPIWDVLERWSLPLVIACVVAYLGIYSAYIVTWPPVSSDEGREMNAFWSATNVDPDAALMDPIYGVDPLYKGGLQGLSAIVAFKVLGPGLWVARLVSTIWGGVLLVATFLFARAVFGAASAAVATILLASVQPFLYSSHFFRPEIVVAALVMIALRLAVLTQVSWIGGIVAGFVAGLAVDVHLNALGFVPLVGLVHLSTQRRTILASAFRFVGGLAAGAMAFVIARVLPDPTQFAQSFQFWVGVEKRPPIFESVSFSLLVDEWARFADYFGSRPVEGLLISVGLLWAVVCSLRGSRIHAAILTGLVCAFLFFSAFASNKVHFYLVLYFTPFMLLLGDGLAASFRRLPAAGAVGLVTTGLVALMGFGLFDYARDLAYHYKVQDHSYALLQQQLRESIPPDAVVVAQPVYWPALADRRFVDLGVAFRARSTEEMSLSEFLRRTGGTVVLMDDDMRRALPREERAWLSDNSEKVATITQKYYGTIDVRILGPRV